MHFMNCQLVRCILLIYGRENAFHELSTRGMHPLYLWEVECISWTVYSWYASSLIMEGRMHFMNCQLVRCILLIYGREDAFHELSTREMHLSIYEREDAFHELSTREMHLSIYGREDAFHELSTREMHPLYLWKVECISWTVNSWDASLYIWKGGCISWTINSWDASSLFMEDRMHFMNCQLVRCILSIYGR